MVLQFSDHYVYGIGFGIFPLDLHCVDFQKKTLIKDNSHFLFSGNEGIYITIDSLCSYSFAKKYTPPPDSLRSIYACIFVREGQSIFKGIKGTGLELSKEKKKRMFGTNCKYGSGGSD